MHRWTVFVLLAILAFASVPGLFSSFPLANAIVSNSSSCPASLTYRITFGGGAPNAINALTASSESALDISDILWYGVTPVQNPATGQQYWNMSVTDWYKANSNFTVWTFNVKPGLLWANGQPVTASDILATYSKSFGFSSALDFTGVHSEVVSETALNTSAVQFVLNKSDAEFADTIGPNIYANVMPAAYDNANFTGFGQNVYGVGPFYVANYTAGSTSMVMVRNPYFYSTGLPEPKMCQLDITFVETNADVANRLLEGSADLAYPLDPASVSSLSGHPNLGYWAYPREVLNAAYNITLYPFNMTAFRQAIAYSVNQSQIVSQAFYGLGLSSANAEGGVPSTVTGYYNPSQQQYPYNPQKAISLLNSIGITKGSDGYMHYPNGTAVKITMWVDNSEGYNIVAAGIVQTDLNKLGIQTVFNPVSHGTLASFPIMTAGAMYMSRGPLVTYDPYQLAVPGWDIYTHPALISPYWEYPPSANNQYNANLTGFTSTTDPATQTMYLKNIEALNAEYLPVFMYGFVDDVCGYSTASWVGYRPYPYSWCQSQNPDLTFLSPSSGIVTSGTSAISTGTNIPLSTIAIIVVVVIIILAGATAFFIRRRSGHG